MKTLVIFNKETGAVIMTQSGDSTFPAAVDCLTTDVPSGKEVESVNTETGEVILVDTPKTEEQIRLDALEAQMAALTGTEEE